MNAIAPGLVLLNLQVQDVIDTYLVFFSMLRVKFRILHIIDKHITTIHLRPHIYV